MGSRLVAVSCIVDLYSPRVGDQSNGSLELAPTELSLCASDAICSAEVESVVLVNASSRTDVIEDRCNLVERLRTIVSLLYRKIEQVTVQTTTERIGTQ